MRTRLKTPGQNGSREHGFGTLKFDRGTGDLVTAFVPKNDQLGAMLRLLGQ